MDISLAFAAIVFVVIVLFILMFRKRLSVSLEGFGLKAEMTGENKAANEASAPTDGSAMAAKAAAAPSPEPSSPPGQTGDTSISTTIGGGVDRSTLIIGRDIRHND